ncbi:MAG: flavodoxin-dependent (E)-4-hydroxy-3-methylbut-2-enyl-diphosphate synthase [bacterium]
MMKKSRVITIGGVKIGGANPLIVQSMTNTRTEDIDATVGQIHRLESAGCEMVRVAVPTLKAARALSHIKQQINIPLVADIHFDYKLALAAADHVDKLRINPGNIGSLDAVRAVVSKCKEKKIPIRIGVNLGSIDKEIALTFGRGSKALVESAKKHIMVLEKEKFDQIVVSLKSSDVRIMYEANREFRQQFDYPLHLGVTEAGVTMSGAIKSAVGIGALVLQGIGETIRVSLSGDPVHEIPVAYQILIACGVRKRGREIISCPTCGRTHGDLAYMAHEIEKRTDHIKAPLKIAVMGCEVNGPGEAKEADIGMALGDGCAIVFVKGNFIKKVSGPPEDIINGFLEQMRVDFPEALQ